MSNETPLGVLVGRLALADPARPAITCEGETVSRAELEARTNRLARAYRELGVTRATTSDARAEIALLASYLRQPGSARAFSRTVRDVIRWQGQTRNIFDRIAEVAELPPMRLFWGASDDILPISQGIAIAALLENCELTRFENRGHFVQWEDPEGFASALRDFLDSRNAPAARLSLHPARPTRLSTRETNPLRRLWGCALAPAGGLTER